MVEYKSQYNPQRWTFSSSTAHFQGACFEGHHLAHPPRHLLSLSCHHEKISVLEEH